MSGGKRRDLTGERRHQSQPEEVYEPQIPQCFPAVSCAEASAHYALHAPVYLLSVAIPPPWCRRTVHLKKCLWGGCLVQEQDETAPAAFLQVVPHRLAQTERALPIPDWQQFSHRACENSAGAGSCHPPGRAGWASLSSGRYQLWVAADLRSTPSVKPHCPQCPALWAWQPDPSPTAAVRSRTRAEAQLEEHAVSLMLPGQLLIAPSHILQRVQLHLKGTEQGNCCKRAAPSLPLLRDPVQNVQPV